MQKRVEEQKKKVNEVEVDQKELDEKNKQIADLEKSWLTIWTMFSFENWNLISITKNVFLFHYLFVTTSHLLWSLNSSIAEWRKCSNERDLLESKLSISLNSNFPLFICWSLLIFTFESATTKRPFMKRRMTDSRRWRSRSRRSTIPSLG